MKLGMMQPYFFPYIGYFQLINAVDEFILADNYQYTRYSWINRNRFLFQGNAYFISLPVRRDHLVNMNINSKYLSDSWQVEKYKILNKITEYYRKAPYFNSTMDLIEKCILFNEINLFDFIHHSITTVTEYLDIKTLISLSSAINLDSTSDRLQKAINVCKLKRAVTFINPIGGITLYDKSFFGNRGIDLLFIKMRDIKYKQFDDEFIPSLSIIDVMMFNPKETIKKMLYEYDLF